MKYISVIFIFCLVPALISRAQVGANEDGSRPDSSAMLDVKSTTKGMLVPRMTSSQRDQISAPATGLVVMCTDSNLLYVNRGTPNQPAWSVLYSQWIASGQNLYYNQGNVGIGTSNPDHRLTIQTYSPDGQALRLIGPLGYYGHGARLDFGDNGLVSLQEDEDDYLLISTLGGTRITGGSVGIGTLTPNNSAALDLDFTNRGFLLPRLTTAQMNALASPPEGLMVYNTTMNAIAFFNGTSWDFLDGGSCGDINYQGQTFHTVIIGQQCWMKENLGNYNWNSMMSNSPSSSSNPSGVQGVCPPGWHVPSDAEWCQLEQYLEPSIVCDLTGWRGWGAGVMMGDHIKDLWYETCPIWIPIIGVKRNSSGFSAIPEFPNGEYAYFWSSTEDTVIPATAYYRKIMYPYIYTSYPGSDLEGGVYRENQDKSYNLAVRCLKD